MHPASTQSETVFTGPATIDVVGRVNSKTRGTKQEGEVEFDFGGGALNSAKAYQSAGGRTIACPITGADHAGNLLMHLIAASFLNARRIATAAETRKSVIVHGMCAEADDQPISRRFPFDQAGTFNHLQPFLCSGRRLVIASMTSAESPFVRRLIAANTGDTCLLLSIDQCADRQTTIELMRSCELSQLNLSEAVTLTGVIDNGTGRFVLQSLRKQGVTSVIVTLGRNGAIALIDGREYHVPAFDVPDRNGTTKCGDISFGTFLAALDRGTAVPQALRMAMAAAAMHRAGIRRTDRETIESFLETAKELPVQRTALPTAAASNNNSVVRRPRLGRRIATSAAVLFVMLVATATIALMASVGSVP